MSTLDTVIALIEAIAVAPGYSASAVVNSTYTIKNQPAPEFSITANPTSLNIARGQSGTVTLTITPTNGYTQAVSFACSGLPSQANCTFSPSTVTPANNPVTTQLTITTAPSSAALRESPGLGPWRQVSGVVALGLLIWILPHRRRRAMQGYFLLLLLGLSFCAGTLARDE
jgi:hypothetical protein